ncbi:GAF domain-containing protein [bacterium]|nr:GAF domain-containing protein [bacterium]
MRDTPPLNDPLLEGEGLALLTMHDLDAIASRLMRIVEGTFAPAAAAVLISNSEDSAFVPLASFGGLAPAAFGIDSPLAFEIIESQAMMTAAELSGFGLPAETALAVPLAFERKVHGLLLLGAKRDGTAYGEEELARLRVLSAHGAIAFSHGRAYRTIQDLNHALESKIYQRTRELQEAYRDLKAAQAQLIHGEKMNSLGLLVAGVAHEINNPISFIYSGVGLLETNIDTLRRLRAHLEETLPAEQMKAIADEFSLDSAFLHLDFLTRAFQDGATRIRDIVRSLRSFSRQDAYDYQEVNPRACLESTAALVQAIHRHVRIHLDLVDGPAIPGAEGPLNQVFMNLLVNACQSIEGSGEVWVRLRYAGESCQIEIQDNGQGMTEEVQSHIFEPFFTTKPVGSGTGLGLSICHGILEKHHARIEVESEVGTGSCFKLTFPTFGSEHNLALAERFEA